MRTIFYYILLSIVFNTYTMANVIVETVLPEERGSFTVKVTGEDTNEVRVTIPQCIEDLGIEVKDGNIYTMKVKPNCTYEAPYKLLPEENRK